MLALSIYLLNRHRSSACFISTMNKLPYTFSFIFFGVISISATYIGLAYFHLGLWGLILIPLAVQSIYNNWKWTKWVCQEFCVIFFRNLCRIFPSEGQAVH
ncbi:hypothetical protein ACE418_03815, partial [Megasphaera sp. WILCCON 0056]